ncbi:MAG: hypothetical protein IGS50_11820 [Synechococcales cyanobacterium C42_A2020_086]|nr:hypothetical protein [Synechococcales cyanobacterium C42_A2020_086]
MTGVMTRARTVSTTTAAPTQDPSLWLRQSVEQFFSHCNWDNHPPDLQAWQQSAGLGNPEPLSLLLTVQQFLSAVNWEGTQIAAPLPVAPNVNAPADQDTDALTLDDFSGLF